MRVVLYVEGGGHRAVLKAQLRKGFRDLLVKAGFAGRLPKVVACGPRGRTYQNFKAELRRGNSYPILLVDSESVVQSQHQPPNSSGAWQHLDSSDHWTQPIQASNDQAQLMAACMETWLMADHKVWLSYSPGLNPGRLLPVKGLEERQKEDVIQALKSATASSRRGRYDKGRDSFAVLGLVDPTRLERWLPHFRRFVETLDARLEPPFPPS